MGGIGRPRLLPPGRVTRSPGRGALSGREQAGIEIRHVTRGRRATPLAREREAIDLHRDRDRPGGESGSRELARTRPRLSTSTRAGRGVDTTGTPAAIASRATVRLPRRGWETGSSRPASGSRPSQVVARTRGRRRRPADHRRDSGPPSAQAGRAASPERLDVPGRPPRSPDQAFVWIVEHVRGHHTILRSSWARVLDVLVRDAGRIHRTRLCLRDTARSTALVRATTAFAWRQRRQSETPYVTSAHGGAPRRLPATARLSGLSSGSCAVTTVGQPEATPSSGCGACRMSTRCSRAS